MEWNVKNALSRDVEREHLNKILKEIQASITGTDTGITEARVLEIVQAAIAGIGGGGNASNWTLTLEGDVLGSAAVVNLSDTTLTATLAPGVAGVPEAPVDSNAYWRSGGSWQAVPGILRALTLIEGDGALFYSEEAGWLIRQIEGVAGEIVVTDGDGVDGNPTIGLAPVADAGVAPLLLKIVRDGFGRVTATQQATAYDVPVEHLTGATYDNLQEFLNVMNSPGLIQGGAFTDGGGGNLNVAAGTMAIRPTDNDVTTLYLADFPATVLAIPNDSTSRFVGVQYNAGVPQVIQKTSDTWDQDTEFPLGSVANLGGTLFPFYNPFKVGDPMTNIIQRFDGQARLTRSANGGLLLGNTGTRNATVSAGTIWARLNDYPFTAKNSATVGQSMVSVRPTGLGTIQLTAGLTQWPNTQYTDPTGTLITMGNNRWSVLWYFLNPGTGAWGFAYHDTEYLNASGAALAQIPSYLSANFLASNLLIGRMLFEKNSNTPIVESAFTTSFGVAGVADHNQLSNLQGGQLGEYYHLTATQHGLIPATAGTSAQFLRGDWAYSNTLTGPILATGLGVGSAAVTPADFVHISGAAGSQCAIRFSEGATLRGVIGIAGTAGQIIVGSNAADTCFRSENGTFRFSTGATVSYVLDATQFRPSPDNTKNLGSSALRWSTVYAATGTINTSDAREKTEVIPLSESEIAASRDLAKEIGTYQWLESIERNGADARLHIGMTVQSAIEVMRKHGLDPFRYGFICYDAWDAAAALTDDEGREVHPAREAGDRYSFRMDELMMFLARGFEARLAALESEGK